MTSLKLRLIHWKRTREVQQELARAFPWSESVKGNDYWHGVVLSLGDELYQQEVDLLIVLRNAGYTINPMREAKEVIDNACLYVLQDQQVT
jgi:hypothetical protein